MNLSGILREDCVLRFLENKMLRKIFGVKVRREQDAKAKVKWEALWFVVLGSINSMRLR